MTARMAETVPGNRAGYGARSQTLSGAGARRRHGAGAPPACGRATEPQEDALKSQTAQSTVAGAMCASSACPRMRSAGLQYLKLESSGAVMVLREPVLNEPMAHVLDNICNKYRAGGRGNEQLVERVPPFQ